MSNLVRLCRPTRSSQFLRPHNILRPLTTSSPQLANSHPNPQHEAQKDRKKMNTDANEYAKSGTDDTVAQNEDAAFDPDITDPQEAKRKAGQGNKVNPLDASPANPEISKGTSEVEGGAKKKEISEGGSRKQAED